MQTTPTTTMKKISIAALSLAAICVLASWGYKQTQFKYNDGIRQTKDTIPAKKIADLDEALKQLDEAEKQLSGSELQAKISAALSQVDAQKIKQQVQAAMKEAELAIKNIDMEKIKAEVTESLAKVDFDKIKPEIEKAMATAKVDMERAVAEMKAIDQEGLQKEMKKAYDEMEKIKPEMEKAMKNMEIDLSKAKVEIEKARVELKDYKTVTDGLEKEGLLNTDNDYTVEYKDGGLYVNGKKMSQDVYKKHEPVLKKYPGFKIKKTAKSFNISKDNEVEL